MSAGDTVNTDNQLHGTPDEAAFKNMADLLKFITGLATGSLVFSIGLLSPTGFDFVGWIRIVLAVTWVLLFFAVVAGVWAQSLLPLLLKKNNLDINTPELRAPVMAMEALFLLGILGIASSLIATLITAPSLSDAKLATPIAAIQAAKRYLPADQHIIEVTKVELLKGVAESRNSNDSWHVRLSVDKTAKAGQKIVTRDFYIDPATSSIFEPLSAPTR